MSNYCEIDFNSANSMCKEITNNIVTKYNDFVPCTGNNTGAPPVFNNNTINANWNCNDRASCNMGMVNNQPKRKD